MSESPSVALVRHAVIPMALASRDGLVVVTSTPWDHLFADGKNPDGATLGDAISSGTRAIDVRAGGDGALRLRLQLTEVSEHDRVLIVATDITTLTLEAEDLRDRVEFMEWQALSMSTLSKVMQHARIILFSMNGDGTTTLSDGKGLELIGERSGERVGRNELQATRGTATHDHLKLALGGQTVQALVEPVPGVHFDTWYMPLRDPDNRVEGVLGMAVDATDRVLSERRLAEKLELIEQQSETIRELGAPIIKVWDQILCMPIIGSVDGDRAGRMMEDLLTAVVREQARFAILDLTGAEVMDTCTVDHMIRILNAARTIGIVGVLSGVRPAVAQTMVTLGINLDGLRMMRTLHDALAWCLEGTVVARRGGSALRAH